MQPQTLSSDFLTEITACRRHLHQHPELAFSETATADFVAAKLAACGLAIHRGLARTGVVGTLTRGTSPRTIAIRADMDALPIKEHSGVVHTSANPNVMHACGHDGHVAMALGAAHVCANLPDLNGTVHFIFQPAEENEGGARRMIEEGLFKIFPCDSIYALHNWPTLPLGTCVARDGPIMAAFATFEIEISGRGCHAAMPHNGSDTVLAACQLVGALHTITSRNIDPAQGAVVSATQIHSGHTWNVLPDTCVIRGTTRWFDDIVGETLEGRITTLATSIATAFSCEATVRYERRYVATINNARSASLVREVAATPDLRLHILSPPPSMVGEDFAFMLQEIPGCYFWLGTGKLGENPGLHSPRYDFNDEALPVGIALWVSLVQHCLT